LIKSYSEKLRIPIEKPFSFTGKIVINPAISEYSAGKIENSTGKINSVTGKIVISPN